MSQTQLTKLLLGVICLLLMTVLGILLYPRVHKAVAPPPKTGYAFFLQAKDTEGNILQNEKVVLFAGQKRLTTYTTPCRVELAIRRGESVRVEWRGSAQNVSPNQDTVTFIKTPDGSFNLVVTAKWENGEPVRNYFLQLRCRETNDVIHESQTDDGGVAVLVVDRRCEYTVTCGGVTKVIPPGERTAAIVLPIPEYSGTVTISVQKDGKGFPGHLVEIISRADGKPIDKEKTDAKGDVKFTLRLRAGTQIRAVCKGAKTPFKTVGTIDKDKKVFPRVVFNLPVPYVGYANIEVVNMRDGNMPGEAIAVVDQSTGREIVSGKIDARGKARLKVGAPKGTKLSARWKSQKIRTKDINIGTLDKRDKELKSAVFRYSPPHEARYDFTLRGKPGRHVLRLKNVNVKVRAGEETIAKGETNRDGQASFPVNARFKSEVIFRFNAPEYKPLELSYIHSVNRDTTVSLVYSPDTTSFVMLINDAKTGKPIQSGFGVIKLDSADNYSNVDYEFSRPGMMVIPGVHVGHSYDFVFQKDFCRVKTAFTVRREKRANRMELPLSCRGTGYIRLLSKQPPMNPVTDASITLHESDGTSKALSDVDSRGITEFETSFSMVAFTVHPRDGIHKWFKTLIEFDKEGETLVVPVPLEDPLKQLIRYIRNLNAGLQEAGYKDEANDRKGIEIVFDRALEPEGATTKLKYWRDVLKLSVSYYARSSDTPKSEWGDFLSKHPGRLAKSELPDPLACQYYSYQGWANIVLDQYLEARNMLKRAKMFYDKTPGPSVKWKREKLLWIRFYQGKVEFELFQKGLSGPGVDHTLCSNAKKYLNEYILLYEEYKKNGSKYHPEWESQAVSMLTQLRIFCP